MVTSTRAENFGEMIRALRIYNRWSMRELGERAGVTGAAINNIEHGHNYPQMGTLAKLDAAFGGRIEELYEQLKEKKGEPTA